MYISTLYFGNGGGSINGQLTTDSTATNLYWKGTQINGLSGTVTISASYGYSAYTSVSITGMTTSSIIMITPYDDLTESGTTIITYLCQAGTGQFTIYLNVATNVFSRGNSVDFGQINHNHTFMYNVVPVSYTHLTLPTILRV